MCRSIKTLRGLEPAATPEDVHAAALQYVRKISGYRRPSRANAAAFDAAVQEIEAASLKLLQALPAANPSPLKGVLKLSSVPQAATASREVLQSQPDL